MPGSYTFLEFFAGGGMARAGLGAAWQCLLSNDIDPEKCAAYRRNFGGSDLFEGDINDLTLSRLPDQTPDLAWASFPCQDLSLAGARGGIRAERSGVFFPFWKIMEGMIANRHGPKIIAIENVTGLLTSNGGCDFATIIECLAQQNYQATALVVDAKNFVPQSRPRLFILGFADGVSPLMADETPSATLAPNALHHALTHLSSKAQKNWGWLDVSLKNQNRTRLSDIIEWDTPDWHKPAQTAHLLSMMSDSQRQRVDALIKHRARRIGTAFRRTRTVDGKSVQRIEARFDGLAGCLRTPAGGSSRQIVFAIENGNVRSRLFTPRETARLMGLPEDYILPENNTAALKLTGDGVCVPVVRWLAEQIFEPSLGVKRNRKAA
ncbi:DNA cytosine methyltransferase [Hyphococcus formosus]|uniref:DNA cytosine methyltransferase n=1 Tax=Hyphococcus formosus TaxID=3143534 RepID=UPI00398B7781